MLGCKSTILLVKRIPYIFIATTKEVYLVITKYTINFLGFSFSYYRYKIKTSKLDNLDNSEKSFRAIYVQRLEIYATMYIDAYKRECDLSIIEKYLDSYLLSKLQKN